MRGWGIVWTTVAIVLGLAMASLVFWAVNYGMQPESEYEQRTLRVGDKSLRVEVADTDALQTLGLSGREGLKDGHGMLFPYAQPGEMCFWMKDMRFAIDMVWIDATKKVVKVAEAVAPETYPDTFCAPDDKPAQYVLEVSAGQAARYGLRDGATVSF